MKCAQPATRTGNHYRVDMRWTVLFEDFEAQLAAASVADNFARATELARIEASAVTVADRLRAATGDDVRLVLQDGRSIVGMVQDVANEWLLMTGDLGTRRGGQTLIPVAAIDVVHRLGWHVSPERSPVRARLGLGHTLRALARDRVTVRVGLASADLVGRIDRVGKDHLDLNPRIETGSGRMADRAGQGSGLVLIPFGALMCVSDLG